MVSVGFTAPDQHQSAAFKAILEARWRRAGAVYALQSGPMSDIALSAFVLRLLILPPRSLASIGGWSYRGS
jgi:hypothetical protein